MGFPCHVMIRGALVTPPHSLLLAASHARWPPFTYAVDDHQEVLNTPLPSVSTQREPEMSSTHPKVVRNTLMFAPTSSMGIPCPAPFKASPLRPLHNQITDELK